MSVSYKKLWKLLIDCKRFKLIRNQFTNSASVKAAIILTQGKLFFTKA